MDVARTEEHSAALAKFEGRNGGRGAGDVAPKPREGNSEQGAHDDPDGGLVADEQHGPGAVIVPDPIEHRQGAPCDLVRAPPPGGDESAGSVDQSPNALASLTRTSASVRPSHRP